MKAERLCSSVLQIFLNVTRDDCRFGVSQNPVTTDLAAEILRKDSIGWIAVDLKKPRQGRQVSLNRHRDSNGDEHRGQEPSCSMTHAIGMHFPQGLPARSQSQARRLTAACPMSLRQTPVPESHSDYPGRDPQEIAEVLRREFKPVSVSPPTPRSAGGGGSGSGPDSFREPRLRRDARARRMGVVAGLSDDLVVQTRGRTVDQRDFGVENAARTEDGRVSRR